MTKTETLVTIEEACELLGVSKPTLYKYAREHPRWLTNHRRGRRRMFDRGGLQKFIEHHKSVTQL